MLLMFLSLSLSLSVSAVIAVESFLFSQSRRFAFSQENNCPFSNNHIFYTTVQICSTSFIHSFNSTFLPRLATSLPNTHPVFLVTQPFLIWVFDY